MKTIANNVKDSLSHYQPFKTAATIDIDSSNNANDFKSGIILVCNWVNLPSQDWYMLISCGENGTQAQLAFNLWNGERFWRYCAAWNWTNWISK